MAKLTKKQVEALSKELTLPDRTVWGEADKEERKEIFAMGERFKDFLDRARTERMAVNEIIRQARAKGFRPLGARAVGNKLYVTSHGKVIALVVLGRQPVEKGLRIVGAHIDCPRLDLKMHPLYEDMDMAWLKTHYYGGIKKYQWLARPLAIHGVVCTRNGESKELHIGDDPDDPVFSIMDLLPHLSRKAQGQKKLDEAIEAERMNLLLAGLPIDSDHGKDKVKLAVLQYLNKTYGITEPDLISAELEVVPAGKARDVGLDRIFVGGYGQDDRVSAFCALEAIFAVSRPQTTCVALFVDKEEIGSDGATGAKSLFIEHLTGDIIKAQGGEPTWRAVSTALANSKALSTDVNAGVEPDYAEVHEKRNAAFMGRGVTLTKYTGHGGKYGASDADAEFVAWVRDVWDKAKVVWQAAGMGKVDEGGGGTIAKLLAVYAMEVIDAGPPVMSMHSPFEISHKGDIYSSRQAYAAFLQAK